ncbi:MAG: S66 peptidase family protein [Paludibacter sp.]
MLPPFLKPNDQIRIISPSGAIDTVYIDGAKKILESWNLQVTEGAFARSEYGRFAGTKVQRLNDLQLAFDDPEVKAILCSRGGYGVSQIIDKIDFSNFINHPKWLIGFSDITILHNAINNLGVASIHGIMAKHLTELPIDSEQIIAFKKTLLGEQHSYSISNEQFNKPGTATGKLIGGNLSVLMGLRGSQFDSDYKNAILFIEDIGEKPYHIDRMMQNLRFSGALSQLSGLIVGQFSDCEEDQSMKQTISEIIVDAVSEYSFPVCFNFPAGHVDYNLPLILGANVKLEVSEKKSQLSFY